MTRGVVSTSVGRRGVVAALLGAALLAVLTGCSIGSQPSAERDCANAVLADWSDGRIDRAHSGRCYLAALDALPEDLRAYTSAADDITRALQSSTRASATRSTAATPPVQRSKAAAVSEPPAGLLGLAGFAGLVVIAGVAGFALRRLRRPRA